MRDLPGLIILLLALFVASAHPAHAYLDPGSGSYILQMALAGGLGALFVFKNSIRVAAEKIRGIFTKEKTTRPDA